MTLSSIVTADEATPVLRWEIRDGGPPRLTSLRRAVARALPDLDEDTIIDVKLICTELVTNVYQHARTSGELRITRPADETICIEVDDGSSRPPLKAAGAPGERRCRGWDIVDAVAKQWGVRPAGTGKTVWVEIDSRSPVAASA